MNLGKNSKIIKNATWIIGCRIVQAVLNLVISMVTARYLGPSNYGLVNYAMSITAFFAPIMNLGINSILVNEILLDPEHDNTTLGTAIRLTLLSSGICIVGIASFVCIVNAGETETLIVCVLYSVSLIAQSLELVRYWFQAVYLSKYTSVVMLAAYVLVSIYKIVLLVTNKSVYWFAVANVLDYFIIAAVLLLLYRKITGKRLKFSFKTAKRLLKNGHHYIISNMMVTVFAQTDRIMIKAIIGEEAVGYYSAALTIAGMTSFVFAAIIDSMRPAILEHKSKEKADYESYIKKLYCIVIYLALLQSIAMAIFAEYIVKIMYGPAYLPAIQTLRIAVWYTMFSYIGAVRDVWILAEGKHKYLRYINMLGVLANILLNWILIPRYGIYGAAAATLMTQIFTNVFVGFALKPIRYNNKLMLRSLNPVSVFNLHKNQ